MPASQGRIVITGASGDLGRPLSALAARSWQTTSFYYSHPHVGGGTPAQLNLRDERATLDVIARLQPDVIIHAAGSDRSPDMVTTNREAARSVVSAANATGARLLALSTDMVFDGTHPPYPEDAAPEPLSDYGRVKAENEALFLGGCRDCLVVRTSLIYDFAPPNRQAGWLLQAAGAGQRVPLFVDEIRSPIWAWNLAQALLELAKKPVTGLLHVAGPEPVSRWELGTMLLRELGYDGDKVAERTSAAEVAPHRPRDLTLSVDRATRILTTPLLTLDDARREAARR